MRLLILICYCLALERGLAVPFSNLTKIDFQFFTNLDSLLGSVMSRSFMVNIPSCIPSTKYVPTSLKLAVASSDPSGIRDTDNITSLRNDSTAKVYYAGQIRVPQCRLKRDVVEVIISGPDNSFTLSSTVGYQVGSESCANASGLFCNRFLQPGSSYRVNFIILDEFGVSRAQTGWSEPKTTINVTGLLNLETGLTGRSGGMVVITVLLSIALFLLLLGLFFMLFITRKEYLFPSESQDCLERRMEKPQ